MKNRRSFLASSLSLMAGPAVLAGHAARRTFSQRNERKSMDEGRLTKHDLATPALIVDLDAFEKNVTKMAAHAKATRRSLRPHAKTHKCPEIARAQIRAGAAGQCVATLHEAEIFATHGIRGILITAQMVGKPKLKRLTRLAAASPDVMVCVDNASAASDLSEAAAAARVDINVCIDLNVGGRTGIQLGQPVVELMQHIAKLPRLKFRGLQSYAGQASHTVGFEKRIEVSKNIMGQAVETRQMLEKAGFEVPLLTGGSTGTYNIDCNIDGVTELQPGSYVFMDVDYLRIGGQAGDVYTDFQPSLSVIGTAVSVRPAQKIAIVDAGYKAFSTDRPFGPECSTIRGLKYSWAGDEHGRLDFSNAEREVKLGDRLEFIIPHCDPSINLYDKLYAVRGERVEAVWAIAARGYSA